MSVMPELVDAYREWLMRQSCEDCGAKQADRPRDSRGWCTDMFWPTETLCWECWKTRAEAERPRVFKHCQTCTCHMKAS
jgi:hypothetical protein